ncbi:DUF6771 family protein [Sphingomonas lycopersici]|uniref:Uncharacterized protein n=1 Tax=Sphingomonas lycopersici TaxID=2951807 RepID=A0AA41ZAH8_9SPHN|nr:DUF6771 family protein [Sphingomonas lycopersici]MCW6535988.1 hypothetical protein [Sphingomonas lycopersici]
MTLRASPIIGNARVMDDIQPIILAAVERAPQWVRHDLASPEATIRTRAEEAMAAIITQALRNAEGSGH